MDYERKAGKLLRRLGVGYSYAGFWYAAEAAGKAAREPWTLSGITKGAYVDIALRHRVSVSCVERDIRTVRDVIWESGDRALLEELFRKHMKIRGPLKKRPGNTALIEAIARHIREGEE